MSDPSAGPTTIGGCILAAFRNLAGPGLLIAMGGAHLANRPAMGSVFDVLFLLVAAANVAAGLLYQSNEVPVKDAPDKPVMVSRRAFVATILAATALVWGITHFVLGSGR